ncbi:hypothetical protein IQ274_35360 [Nostoc sp. LEGE 12447]|uniref:hypothetical protein n=1 Tax=Nostoc sp. LEGE 12447 TaxID=1828640 RepID=UPI0018841D4D|nr:hypothetical protein [Nostoc sp. LEGE 12447]MBE9003297.1 hypothetical protein [Nostoc sp. LEGE 12447]
MIKLLIKYAPDSVVDAVNDISLAELDKRGLIVWTDAPPLEPEAENSAFNLASRFTEVTPDNLLEVFMTIAQIYTLLRRLFSLEILDGIIGRILWIDRS